MASKHVEIVIDPAHNAPVHIHQLLTRLAGDPRQWTYTSPHTARPADTTYSDMASRGGEPNVINGFDYSNEDVGQ